jgi:hypothetical protein
MADGRRTRAWAWEIAPGGVGGRTSHRVMRIRARSARARFGTWNDEAQLGPETASCKDAKVAAAPTTMGNLAQASILRSALHRHPQLASRVRADREACAAVAAAARRPSTWGRSRGCLARSPRPSPASTPDDAGGHQHQRRHRARPARAARATGPFHAAVADDLRRRLARVRAGQPRVVVVLPVALLVRVPVLRGRRLARAHAPRAPGPGADHPVARAPARAAPADGRGPGARRAPPARRRRRGRPRGRAARPERGRRARGRVGARARRPRAPGEHGVDRAPRCAWARAR